MLPIVSPRSVGVVTPLQRYPTTALGASEVTLLELATAYRTIATGALAPPRVIRQIVLRSGEVLSARALAVPVLIDPEALALIRKGSAAWCACRTAPRTH